MDYTKELIKDLVNRLAHNWEQERYELELKLESVKKENKFLKERVNRRNDEIDEELQDIRNEFKKQRAYMKDELEGLVGQKFEEERTRNEVKSEKKEILDIVNSLRNELKDVKLITNNYNQLLMESENDKRRIGTLQNERLELEFRRLENIIIGKNRSQE